MGPKKAPKKSHSAAKKNNEDEIWSDEKEDNLIELYEENSVLYDPAHKRYYDAAYKDSILAKIASVLGVTGE